nr:putative ribonuclease H-like domain-containing protein [Tanacetum cinerariifolium]GFA44054.1 putative ribonuclease H-like domain-containing protein [Tanacetum cinerariifolium]
APMLPPFRSVGHRPHGTSMRPSNRLAGHRPHGPSMNPIRPNMNDARPNRSFFIQASSYETRPFYKSSAVKTPHRAPWVPTVNRNTPPVNRKFSTAQTITLLIWEGREKLAVPRIKLMTKAIGTVDALGCKITRKGTIKTGKLEFENVYFVKDLKDLTCLVANASADECMLWHRRLVTDDFSRFTWTFFLKYKDETSGILKKFITEIENLKDLKVKIIRCDNEGEFRNKEINDFCSQKGIKREFSNARTPQQNGVAKKRNRTLIEAARTMLTDSKLHVTFWVEAVNTACYVQTGS